MAIQRKMSEPPSIVNEAGEPEISLEINGLKLSMTPPKTSQDDTDDRPANPT